MTSGLARESQPSAQIRWGLEYIKGTYGPDGTGAYFGDDLFPPELDEQ